MKTDKTYDSMRMWMTNPKKMCRAHLLGEHAELHKFRPSFERGMSIVGRVAPPAQIEPLSMKARHDALAAEMADRGYKHASPYEMPDLSKYDERDISAKADRAFNETELRARCERCNAAFQNDNAIA